MRLQWASFHDFTFLSGELCCMTCKCDHLPGQLSSILTLFGWHCAVYQRCFTADGEITLSLVRFLTGAACQSVVLKPP